MVSRPLNRQLTSPGSSSALAKRLSRAVRITPPLQRHQLTVCVSCRRCGPAETLSTCSHPMVQRCPTEGQPQHTALPSTTRVRGCLCQQQPTCCQWSHGPVTPSQPGAFLTCPVVAMPVTPLALTSTADPSRGTHNTWWGQSLTVLEHCF